MNSRTIKRGPGRPKKLQLPTDNLHGLISKPENSEIRIIFEQHNMEIFEKVGKLFKNHNCIIVTIIFDYEKITLYGVDHSGKINMHAEINCHNVKSYYCDEVLRVDISRTSFDLFGKNNKTISNITIIIENEINSGIFVKLYDKKQEYHQSYCLKILKYEENYLEDILQNLPSGEEYPIRFDWDSEHFKAQLSKSKGKLLRICKYMGEPFYINSELNEIDTMKLIFDEKKINLKCNIQDDDIFMVSLNSNKITPFSNLNISGNVDVMLDKADKAIFTSYFTDNFKDGKRVICTLKMYIDIEKIDT